MRPFSFHAHLLHCHLLHHNQVVCVCVVNKSTVYLSFAVVIAKLVDILSVCVCVHLQLLKRSWMPPLDFTQHAGVTDACKCKNSHVGFGAMPEIICDHTYGIACSLIRTHILCTCACRGQGLSRERWQVRPTEFPCEVPRYLLILI